MGWLVDEDTLTVAEAARLLHVSESTIWRWINQGMLPAYRVGRRRVRIRHADLREVVRPRDAASESEPGPGGETPLSPLSEAERRSGLEALARLEAMQRTILQRRGGTRFPDSTEIIHAAREQRSREQR